MREPSERLRAPARRRGWGPKRGCLKSNKQVAAAKLAEALAAGKPNAGGGEARISCRAVDEEGECRGHACA